MGKVGQFKMDGQIFVDIGKAATKEMSLVVEKGEQAALRSPAVCQESSMSPTDVSAAAG